MVAIEHRALVRLGRVDEARAMLESLHVRARLSDEYVGEIILLCPALTQGDEDAKASAIQRNIEAGTGPTTLAVAIDLELKSLLSHPRLGPLVRQLSLFAGREL